MPIKASVNSSMPADELSDSSNDHTNRSPDELDIRVSVDLLNGGQVILVLTLNR